MRSMFKSTLKKTRRLVDNVVRTRPKPVYPPSNPWTYSRHRSDSDDVRPYARFDYELHDEDERTSLLRSMRYADPSTSAPDAQNSSQGLFPSVDTEIGIIDEITDPAAPQPMIMRSYWDMNQKSISDDSVGSEKLLTNGFPNHRLRRTKRSISYGHVDRLNNCRDEHQPCELPARIVKGEYTQLDVKDPLSSDTEDSSNYSSQFVTARSDSALTEQKSMTLQVFDTESGAVFEKVYQGAQKELSGAEVLLDDEFDRVSCQVIPSVHSEMNTGKLGSVGNLSVPVPSLMLTIPTPQIPVSPIFVPQSPITLSKYLLASSASGNPSSSCPTPTPSIPICEQCCLMDLDNGQQCRTCDRQWLACKVWYQANDGGRRQRLTEPYIKPAESNATNRAVMDLLGVPSGPSGLGIRVVPQPVSKSRFRRLAPLLALITEDSSASLYGRGEIIAPGRLELALAFKNLALERLATLFRALCKRSIEALCSSLQDVPVSLKALLGGSRAVWSCDSSLDVAQIHADLALDSRRSSRPSRRLAMTSTSRFFEHLPDTPAVL
ncbi:hypothetical protein AcV7_001022 [Taiwanofungus camphoratus]|nr:hypothetical protein AcV7_001022 [Antrodia cinnamomea]